MNRQQSYSVKQFSAVNWDRNETVFPECGDWEPQDFALAAIGAAGYIGHLLMKRRRGEEVKTGEIFDEIADAAIYLDLLCTMMDGDLTEVLARKFNATSKIEKCHHVLPPVAE